MLGNFKKLYLHNMWEIIIEYEGEGVLAVRFSENEYFEISSALKSVSAIWAFNS